MNAYSSPWPKALSLVLLNLRSTPFGKHHLSPFEIIMGRPMRLDEGLHEPRLLKGDILHYCKGLMELSTGHSFFLSIFLSLFLAVLGLRFCARAFSSCGEWGPLFIAVRGPFTVAATLVTEHRL